MRAFKWGLLNEALYSRVFKWETLFVFFFQDLSKALFRRKWSNLYTVYERSHLGCIKHGFSLLVVTLQFFFLSSIFSFFLFNLKSFKRFLKQANEPVEKAKLGVSLTSILYLYNERPKFKDHAFYLLQKK